MSTNSIPNEKRVPSATKHVREKKQATSGGTALVLRTCAADMTSHGGFRWPESGPVAATDWNPAPVCGFGLHGLLWGDGDGSLLSWEPDARWLVCEVETHSIVDLNVKVKYPRCVVVHCGDRASATRYLADHGGQGRAIVGGTATAGDCGTATAGDRGTATAGYRGVISIRWWDDAKHRFRHAIGYMGEEGLEPNVMYRLDKSGKFVPVQEKL